MHPDVPNELLALDLNSLVGLTAIEARSLVESHGGQLRTYAQGEALRMDLRPNRVTVLIENDRVRSVQGIG